MWYPITPSTSLVEAFIGYAKRYRISPDGKATFAVVQAEDELASIGMALGAGWAGRVRSYSMNAMVGDAGSFSASGVNVNNTNYVQFFRVFSVPHPSDIFVFLDEHPDSIDDGYFAVDMTTPRTATLANIPGNYHGNSAGFSFADGHSELHHWFSSMPPMKPGQRTLNVQASTDKNLVNFDLPWLQAHSTIAN